MFMRLIQLFPKIRSIRSLDAAGTEDADEHGEEYERALDGRPLAVFLEFYWEGFEEEIKEAVDEGVVEGEEEDDRFGG